MLPKAHRLTTSSGFGQAVRRGSRAGSRTVVVHLDGHGASGTGPLVGFVVSKAVGNAVIRNRVKRRLRHLAREHSSSLPGSAVLVVRALPAAASASYAELEQDLRQCLRRATTPRGAE